MFKRALALSISLFVFLLSFSVFAASKGEKVKEFKTVDDCIRTDSSFVFSPEQKEKCKKLIDSFSEETEMVDSSPLGLCRLISGGKAKLISNPTVFVPRGAIIALSERIGTAVFVPVLDNEVSCSSWRERAGKLLVVEPVYKK